MFNPHREPRTYEEAKALHYYRKLKQDGLEEAVKRIDPKSEEFIDALNAAMEHREQVEAARRHKLGFELEGI